VITSFVNLAPVYAYTNSTEIPFGIPMISQWLGTPQLVTSVNQYLAAPVQNVATLAPVIANLPGVFFYAHNNFHSTSLSVSSYVTLDNTKTLEYTIVNRDSLQYTSLQVSQSVAGLEAVIPGIASLYAPYLNDPTVQMFSMNTCVRMSGMSSLHSQEQDMYGYLPFISDLGGILSMLSLAITLLFPVVSKQTQVRQFLPFVLMKRLPAEIDNNNQNNNNNNNNNNTNSGNTSSSSSTTMNEIRSENHSSDAGLPLHSLAAPIIRNSIPSDTSALWEAAIEPLASNSTDISA